MTENLFAVATGILLILVGITATSLRGMSGPLNAPVPFRVRVILIVFGIALVILGGLKVFFR